MEIFELAKRLGEEIAKDHRLIEFDKAKIEYENDAELQAALKEYEVQQQALQMEMLGLLAYHGYVALVHRVDDNGDRLRVWLRNSHAFPFYAETPTQAVALRKNQTAGTQIRERAPVIDGPFHFAPDKFRIHRFNGESPRLHTFHAVHAFYDQIAHVFGIAGN